MRRWLDVLAMGAGVDGRPAPVVHAVADDGPAVVQAGLHTVELVATLRPVLVEPDVTGLRVHGEPLRVAVPVAPDLRERARLAHARIVGRHTAVLIAPIRGGQTR